MDTQTRNVNPDTGHPCIVCQRPRTRTFISVRGDGAFQTAALEVIGVPQWEAANTVRQTHIDMAGEGPIVVTKDDVAASERP